jgi:hypothetical protein
LEKKASVGVSRGALTADDATKRIDIFAARLTADEADNADQENLSDFSLSA